MRMLFLEQLSGSTFGILHPGSRSESFLLHLEESSMLLNHEGLHLAVPVTVARSSLVCLLVWPSQLKDDEIKSNC